MKPLKYVIFSSSKEMDDYAEILSARGLSVLLAHREDEKGWDMTRENQGDKEVDRFFKGKGSNLYSMDADDVIMELEGLNETEKMDYLILTDADEYRHVRELTGFPIFVHPMSTRSSWDDIDDEDEGNEPWNDLNGMS